jgi:serine protease inhibitor
MSRTYFRDETIPSNGPKRDKRGMVRRTNNMITSREFEEAEFTRQRHSSGMDIDRIMLERQMTTHNFEKNDDVFVGEVTGEEFDETDIYDKGMPVRSSFTVKKSRYDNNSHLDFDLFDKVDKKRVDKVAYSDTSTGDYAGLDEAMKSITTGADPYETCISDVNSTTCWMHSNMYGFSKNKYIVNGFGLFSGFGSIYMVSRGNTELELKNYFGFQDKKHLNAGLLTIKDDLIKNRDQIVMNNYIINDKDIPNNINTAKKLKSLVYNLVINRDYPNEEAQRVNGIISKLSGMLDVVSAETLSKSRINLISVAKLTPTWAFKIDNIVKSRFRDMITGTVTAGSFIRFIGMTFNYYEDAERQIAEIPMYGDIFVVGIILDKEQKSESPIELKDLSVAFSYFKPTVLDEVLIPVIKKRFKMRLNKTLQKTGLNVVFSEQEMVGLFPEEGTLDDCLQYVDINFGNKSANKKCENRGYRTTRKLIANRTFEFYLKNIENNCIMMMGRI